MKNRVGDILTPTFLCIPFSLEVFAYMFVLLVIFPRFYPAFFTFGFLLVGWLLLSSQKDFRERAGVFYGSSTSGCTAVCLCWL